MERMINSTPRCVSGTGSGPIQWNNCSLPLENFTSSQLTGTALTACSKWDQIKLVQCRVNGSTTTASSWNFSQHHWSGCKCKARPFCCQKLFESLPCCPHEPALFVPVSRFLEAPAVTQLSQHASLCVWPIFSLLRLWTLKTNTTAHFKTRSATAFYPLCAKSHLTNTKELRQVSKTLIQTNIELSTLSSKSPLSLSPPCLWNSKPQWHHPKLEI